MWNSKNIKKEARKILKTNYWNKFFVCLFIIILVGGYSTTRTSLDNGKQYLEKKFPKLSYIGIDISNLDNKDIAKDFNTTGGFFKIVFDSTTDAISNTKVYVGNIEKTISSTVNDKNAGKITLLGLATLITILFKFFVLNVINVGEARFFLENKNHKKTKFTRIFSNFRKGKYLNTVKVMFFKNLYLLLWYFTIIGGIIKSYSYKMVNYIVAENPNINVKDAIKLSENMMKGYKFKFFLLELSYIPHQIINILSFGLYGVFYLDIYIRTIETEIYYFLRKNHKSNLLNDKNLDLIEDYYPGTKKEERQLDYYRKYNLTSFILFFFTFSIAGWLWEVLLYIIKDGKFVNRGTMFGPWLPIYGAGGVLVLCLLIPKKMKKLTDNPVITFFIITIICSILEYTSGWACEYFNCARWWDYTGYFLNINGRICFECTLFFGIGGVLCIYIVAPFIDKLFKNINKKRTILLCSILIILFSIDMVYSHFNPNTGAGITTTSNISNTIKNSKYCK